MPQLKADFAASAPASSHSRVGDPVLPSKPSAHSHGRGMQRHRVPPLGATAPVRPSLITQQQRDALHVSAFGFSSPSAPQRYDDMSGRTAAGGSGKRVNAVVAASLERSRHTACRDDESVVVVMPEKESARFHLCVQALAEGCVQSYMHLFYLSHREPVCVDVLSKRYFVVPEDRLKWVQEHLSSIEVLRRQSEFPEVLERCRRLADYFEGEKDLEEAAWHYDSALKYASDSLEAKLELSARSDYAEFLERYDQLIAAVDMFESMRSVAIAVKDEENARAAHLALVRVYRALGDKLLVQVQPSVDPALVERCYAKSVQYAQKTNEVICEGEGYDALGKILERNGQLRKALQYQQSYNNVSHQHHLLLHECRAALNVAGLEEQLGHTAEAAVSLHKALRLAKQLGDAEKICRATMQLGEVYRADGGAEEAMTCFKEAFPAAFASGNQDLVDSVRVAMGFASGEYYFANAGGGKGYLPIVCNDVRAQLAWMGNGEL